MSASPGLGLGVGGLAYFEDGPAAEYAFRNAPPRQGAAHLHRLPWFLRVVQADDGTLDVLDLIEDTLRFGERVVAVYRQRSWVHARGVGFYAHYVAVEAPALERCRTNDEWRFYVDEVLAGSTWPAHRETAEQRG